jgi:hypothetical protein
LEGAPDPFPPITDSSPVKVGLNGSSKEDLDTESYSAFPSLASLAPSTQVPTKSVWGSASGSRIRPLVIKPSVFSDSFTITVDVSNANRDGKPNSLGEVMKQVMAKYKVKLEASANQKTRQTTFHLKADSQKELDKAKRSLLALLSPVVSRYPLTYDYCNSIVSGHDGRQCPCFHYCDNHWSQRSAEKRIYETRISCDV